jgi:putative nucleotidyltransferase with HDIG domain
MRLHNLLRNRSNTGPAKSIADAFQKLESDQPNNEPAKWESAAVQDELSSNEDGQPAIELGRLSRLPPFRPVILQLLRLFDRENPAIDEISRLADADLSLVSELLTVVNSPVFSLKAPVMTTSHAISLLGLRRTQSAVATLAVRAMVAGAPRTATIRRFWTHNIATAVLARDLAPLFHVEGGLAYTAALLHDLGRLGLLAAFPEEYSAFAQRVYECAAEIVEREREAFQMDHCKAGARLAVAWNVPEPLAQAIHGHHEAPEGADIRFLVQLSCRLADNLMFKSILDQNNAKAPETISSFAPAALQGALIARVATAEEQILQAVRTLDY